MQKPRYNGTVVTASRRYIPKLPYLAEHLENQSSILIVTSVPDPEQYMFYSLPMRALIRIVTWMRTALSCGGRLLLLSEPRQPA